jgi:basic membrane protein A
MAGGGRVAMKRIVGLLVLVLALFTLTCCQQAPAPEEREAIALVTGLGGLGDNSFNDMGWSGTQWAGEDFGLEPSVTEPKSMADLESIHRENARSGKYLVDVGLGYEHRDAVAAVAEDFPDQWFVLIDEVVDLPNVAAYTFRHREPAFLLGVLAAKMTTRTDLGNFNDDKTVGVVVAVDVPSIHECYTGFVAGAKWADPEVEVLFGEAGAWNDPSKANEIALSQYGQGADIIWHVAGGSGLGVFEAAKTEDLYAFGTDVNQNPLDPDHIMASFLKLVDNAIYVATESAVKGEFEGDVYTLGIKEGGHDITTEGTNIPVPAEYLELVQDAKDQIISGEIVPPQTDEELEAFLGSLSG